MPEARIGRIVLLEPLEEPFDVKAWFAKFDEYLDEPFGLSVPMTL
jgi:hypothetical protein